MRPKRILFVVTGLQGGGAEMMLLHVLRGIDRSRFEPTVIALLEEGRLRPSVEALGIPVWSLGLAPGRPRPMAAFHLIRLVRQARPDFIQGWMYHGNLAAWIASLVVRAPVGWCIQNSFHSFGAERPLTRLTIRLLAILSHGTESIVYVSHAARSQHEALGFDARRGCVIPNGADSSVFVPSAEARISVRAELGLAPEVPLIGLVARFHPQKDHRTFFRAAEILLQRRPDVHFLLAGAGVTLENPAVSDLASRVGGRAHLLGERSDLPRLTAALDLASSSSSYGEALSLAIVEAMACAVPCVVTDVGDSGRLVGDTGIVVPGGDPIALADGWERALASRQRLGEAARLRAVREYSVGAIVRMYEEIYAKNSIRQD